MNEDEKKLGSLKKIKKRILDVIKGPSDINSRSWTEVVIRMKESPKEWDALPRLAWINHLIFKLEEKLKRKWDALPNTTLLKIFCNTELEDRFTSIPLVCKSWKYVTDDPRCWSSMIPDSVSPEDAFIKNTSGYEFKSYSFNRKVYDSYRKSLIHESYSTGLSQLFKEEEVLPFKKKEEKVHDGLSRLRALIKKSGGGAAITTLYLSPFLQLSFDKIDEILHLIANCCPNLKHISFNTVIINGSTKALLQVINKCKKLELVDLSYSYYVHDDAPLVIQEMGKCLPNLHGFRVNLEPDRIIVPIATYLPQLKLLSIDWNRLLGEHLSNILFCCRELHYLYVKRNQNELLDYMQDIIHQASTQIPEFFYDIRWPSRGSDCYTNWNNGYVDMQESTEHIVNLDNDYEDQYSKETHHFHIDDDFRIDDYRDILKQRKKDQYASILKDKMKRKKKNQCKSSLIKKKKKKNSTLKKSKKHRSSYADYVEEYRWLYGEDIVDQDCAQIPECYFENDSYHYDPEWLEWQEWRESMDETYMDDYPYMLKRRKEDQYVSILKEKKKYHYSILKKTERDQCSSSFKRKKKKYQYDSTVRKKKKIDQCDYEDYVIR